jgi:hypothetical protein
MAFWEQATDQAGREFGARYWRWFAGARMARRLAPVIAVAVIAGALVLAYRLIAPDWGAVGSSTGEVSASAGSWFGGWVPDAGRWTLIVLAAIVAVAVLVRVGVALWQAYGWRLRMRFNRF